MNLVEVYSGKSTLAELSLILTCCDFLFVAVSLHADVPAQMNSPQPSDS
jgi:hypothetical protein